jgi:uncharacterized membrane protein YhiD involved in acid resistance
MLDPLFQDINLLPTTGPKIVINVIVALICGYLISWLYRRTYRGPGYTISFANSLILLSMITSIIILVIGNNLARAFGLVGAMSLIRFRHPVKSTQDIVYLFFSLSIGMAAGVGFYTIAIAGTLFIGLIVYLLSKSNLSHRHRDEYLLQFNFRPSGDNDPPYKTILDEYCETHTVINVKSIGKENLLELSYYVKLVDKNMSQDFVKAMHKVPGIQFVNLFFDEEQF